MLGVSVALSAAELHWRTFLYSLIGRGLRGVKLIVSDDHAGFFIDYLKQAGLFDAWVADCPLSLTSTLTN
jgi:Transposase, Mutator family